MSRPGDTTLADRQADDASRSRMWIVDDTAGNRYALAVLTVAMAALVRWSVDPLANDSAHYTPFYLAVAVTAALAGWRAGLLATALGAAAGFWLFIYRPGRFQPGSPQDYVQLGLYLSTSGLITALGEWGRRQRQAAATRIADLKRAEEALRRSNERLKSVLEVEAVGVMFWDLNTGRLVDANETFLKLMGYSRSDLETHALTWQKFTPPEYHEVSLAEIRKFQATGRVGPYEKEYFRKDGTRRWLLFSGSSLGNNSCVEFCVDIADRKKAEEALRHSEERFRVAQELSPDGFILLHPERDADGRIVDFTWIYENDAVARMNGTDPKAIVGRRLLETFPANEGTRFLEAYRQVAQTGNAAIVEDSYQAETIASRTWFRTAVVRTGQDIAVLVQDITERKVAEANLRDSEERLRLAAEGVDMGIWDLDLRTNVATRTLRHDQIFGYSELQPQWTLDLALQHVLPEDRPAIAEAYAVAQKTGRLFHESRVRWPDGSIHWISARGRMHFDAQGGPLRIAGVVFDVTERKQAERKLQASEAKIRAVFRSLAEGIIFIDRDCKVQEVNEASECMGFTLKFLTDPGSDPRFRILRSDGTPLPVEEQPAVVALRTGQPVRNVEMGVLNANGELRWVLESAQPVRDERGGIVGAVASFFDITDRKRMEQSLRESEERLEVRVEQRTAELAAANKELEAFGYTVSHDLRAPLRHVAGFVQMLSDHAASSLDDEGREYLKIISDSAGRMGQLIDDLLTLSRLGRATMNQTDVDLRRLVDDAIAELAPVTNGRSIDWQIGPLPQVQGDRTLLRNVMVNLVSNAVKYSRNRDPARIEIGSQQQDGEVVYFVRDNGAGFDMRFVDKLFGVFQRLHVAEEFEGTGIGLASVRRIIQRHGGRVWAEGAVNQGATFYFALPRSGDNP